MGRRLVGIARRRIDAAIGCGLGNPPLVSLRRKDRSSTETWGFGFRASGVDRVGVSFRALEFSAKGLFQHTYSLHCRPFFGFNQFCSRDPNR